ncbi:DNA repair protein RecO [Pelosinus sp. sgz500959]|uniref:DNA repair protein RecO n=1 Tax=Pelosinus sp. sgz500959 TaxID=3242472 RepID=UPI003673344C
MAQYQAEAILVAVRDWGDADKIVTLFSREHGKIIAFANGARRPKSPLAGGMQLFTHLEVMLLPGKNSDSVKQCEVKHAFRQLQEDFNCMAYGAFIAELTAELCPERQPDPHIFDLLLTVFHVLTVRNPRIVALAYAWQLLSITGYSPEFDRCTLCGQEINFPAYFSFNNGGYVCSQCEHDGLSEINDKVHQFTHCLLTLDWHNPGGFSVNPTVLVQTEKLLLGYLMQCLDRPLKSMNFIKQVASIM